MPKGTRPPGRKKGTPNKKTAAVKEALHIAFEGLGGVPGLMAWGRQPKNRGEFYKLWVKTLPQEIKAEHSGPDGKPIPLCILEEIVEAPRPPDDDHSPAPGPTGLS